MAPKSRVEHLEAGLEVTRLGLVGRVSPEQRDQARLWAHKIAATAERRPKEDGSYETEEDVLNELIGMLGLYVTDTDVEAGISYIPAVVNGVVHTKHRQDPPPRLAGKNGRRKHRKTSDEE